MKIKNINRLVFANLNINSLRAKFDQLKIIISGNIDILVITETKLDDSFPVSQFKIEGYSEPYRFDRNRNGGGVIIYVREDIPSKKLTKHEFPNDIEGIFIEINLRKSKWLVFGTYHPPSQSDQYYFENIGKALDVYNNYDKFLLIGDFNSQETELCLKEFMYQYDSKNIVKDKTCFKNVENPSCIDLFITNSANSFQNTTSVFTGLSDCHKMVLTVMKSTFPKVKPKQITYRNYKTFNNFNFKQDLNKALSSKDVKEYNCFEDVFLEVLNKHAPLKKKLRIYVTMLTILPFTLVTLICKT